MATLVTNPVQIPIQEYLSTSYQPDRDYVDGKVQERHLGEQWHAAVQTTLSFLFMQHRHDWRLRPLVEQRVRTSSSRFRIPDVCAVESSDPLTKILEKAPVLCVEVMSPEDRFCSIVERCREYQVMGVPHVWIIQPHSREIWVLNAAGEAIEFEGPELTMPGTPVRVPIADIFAMIDEAPQFESE